MKDNLPNGWKEATLNDVCEIITDGTHHTPKYEDSGVIFLSSKNVTKGQIDWSDVKYVSDNLHRQLQKRVSPKINDILLAKNGTTGVAAIVDKDLVFDIYVSLALLRPKNEVLPKFLLNFINSPKAKEQFNSRLKGVGVPNLHLREIKEVNLNIPSLDEQKQIVSFLDKTFEKLDQAIVLVEENIQKLKQLNESILDEVFATKRNRFKIGDVLTLKRGYDLPTQNRVNGKIPIVGANGIVGFHNEAKIIGGGVVTGRSGSIGLVHYFEDDFWALNTSLYVRDYKSNLPKYCYYLLKANSEKIKRQATYSAVPTLDRKNVQEKILTEFHQDISEQQQIVAYLDQTTAKNQKLTHHYQNKLEVLKDLKKAY